MWKEDFSNESIILIHIPGQDMKEQSVYLILSILTLFPYGFIRADFLFLDDMAFGATASRSLNGGSRLGRIK
jgi:hypothetical protein